MVELPSGTVTFLLTDVEGSTTLWEEAPEAMHAALARHDALFEETIREHGGVHIRPRGEGDSRFAVFAAARAAAAAAVAIQRAFVAENWPTPRPIKVRIGLHTGEAPVRDGDYYGSAVNRCARLREIGHGGQVLVSEATARLVRGTLPTGAALRDLAEHYLRGFERPERIYQLVHPELPADFPPLAGARRPRHNLPAQTTPLIGREQDVERVCDLLRRDDVRLVTLTGTGGVGKTRVGLEVAAKLLDDFSAGAFFVLLAPISDPSLMATTVAQALGLTESGGQPVTDTLKGYLREKSMLLVLDNFEQILPAAPQVADLLAACARLKVLVTSRAPLQIGGEREYPVPPLALPDVGRPVPADRLSEYAAIALFVERATGVKPDFAVTEENAPALAEVCRRLDGLPLAIEIAAARIRLLSPGALLSRLEHGMAVLTGRRRDLPVRQQSLRSTIGWSYHLLSEPERMLLRRLSVFAGGWSAEAAEGVCSGAGVEAVEAFDLLFRLLEMSLVVAEENGEQMRYRLLETIRQYGLERLREAGEEAALRTRHLNWFLALAETAWPKLVGPEQRQWLQRLDSEHDNFRAALAWSEQATDPESGLRLAWALYRFWWRRGHVSEGRRWLARALERDALGLGQARARALNAAAVLARAQGDYTAARSLFEESLTIFRELGDRWGIANALHNLAAATPIQGDYERVERLINESLTIFRELGDAWGLGTALAVLGGLAADLNDYERAGPLLEESVALAREVGDTWAIAYRLGMLADLACRLGEYGRARDLWDEALVTGRELGDRERMASSLSQLGHLACEQADYERATTLYRESLALRRDEGDMWGIVECLADLARVAGVTGRPEHATRLFGAVRVMRDVIPSPVSPPHRASDTRLFGMTGTTDRDLTAVRSELAEETFAAALAEGRAMTMDEAIAYALEGSAST